MFLHWASRPLLFIARICFFFLAGLFAPMDAVADDFWAWKYRMKVTFSGYIPPAGDETLTNFPALVVLGTNIADFSYSQFVSGTGGDLRFQNSNETVVLNYEIEEWNTNGDSFVWVRLPSLSSSNDSIWAYWGNKGTNPPAYTTNGSVWSASYDGVWHLKENEFPYMDSTAARHNGTTGVAPLSTNCGVAGKAQYFNGLSQKIDIPYASQLNTNIFTVSYWANVAGGDLTYRSPVTSRDDAPQRGYVFYADITNKWGFWQGTGSSWSSLSGPIVTNGTWAYVAGSYDGMNVRLFVNGVFFGPLTVPLALNTARPLRIGAGASEGGGAYWFLGMVDEVRVENTVRSENWLWTCMMSQGSNNNFNVYGRIETRLRGTVIVIQ